MGIKIKKAWNTDLKKEISIVQATDEMRKSKQLRCNELNCKAKLTWAERHKINYNLGTKFYRLLPKEKHSLACKYNTEGQVISILKKSNNKIFENISDGKFEFRINLVFEKNFKKESGIGSNVGEAIHKDRNLKERLIKNKGRKSPYLSTMRDIMKLRSEVEENKDLSSLIKLKFNNVSILWKNFYFELEEEENSYKYIKSKGYTSKNRRVMLSQLICSEFVLKKENIKEYKGIYYIESTAPKFVHHNSDNESHIHKVSLKTKESDVAKNLKSLFKNGKTRVNLVGFYQPNILIKPKSYENKNGITVLQHNIEGWINNVEQIVEIESF